MDEKTQTTLNQLVLALKAFTKSVEKSFHHGMYEGATDVMVKQYRSLHSKAVQVLPDDFYVNESLVLDVTEGLDDEQKISQVMLLSDQLSDYLQGFLKAERQISPATDPENIQDLGRDIQEQILKLTKHTLKRALSRVDVEINVSDEPEPPDDDEPMPEA